MQEEKKEASVNNYTLLKDLGSGLNSKVKLGMDKTTGIHYAIKVARRGPKMSSNRDSMINENKILMDLQHPNIVRLHELCVDGVTTKPGKQPTNGTVFAAIELAANGEMFDYLATLGKFPEPICRFYFKQLLSALDYINSKGYCHRDLKPENLFFDEQFNLKLADFGFATVLQGKLGDGNLTTILGTESYMAPELSIKSQKYHGVPADLFSASVILFIFMTGRPPFRSAHPKDDRYGKMCRNQHKNFWKDIIARGHNLDTSFMELLTSLFAFDPVNRPSIAEIMTSPWMKGHTATHEEAYVWLSKGKQKVDKSMADQKIKDDEDKKKQKAQKNPNQNMAFTETVAHRGEGRSEKSEKKIANDALMAEKLEAMDLNRMRLPVKCCDGILPNTLISGLDRKTFVEHCMQTSSVLALGDLDWNVEKFRAKFVTKGTEMPGDGSEVGVSVTLTECGRGLKYVDISRTSGSAIKFMEIRDNFRQEFEKLLPELEPIA